MFDYPRMASGFEATNKVHMCTTPLWALPKLRKEFLFVESLYIRCCRHAENKCKPRLILLLHLIVTIKNLTVISDLCNGGGRGEYWHTEHEYSINHMQWQHVHRVDIGLLYEMSMN